MNRTVMPNLFSAWGAALDTKDGTRAALRWMTEPALGLPMRHFTVWHLPQTGAKSEKVEVRTRAARTGELLHTWPAERPAAVVRVLLDVTGSTARVRAHTGPSGSGQTADEETIAGPAADAAVTLSGAAIRSVTTTGAVVTGLLVIDLHQYVNDPGWKVLEHVGLPVDGRFAGAYPLDPQGPPGDLLEPVKAAVRRVRRGTPAGFWPAATDTGAPVPPFTPPDPDRLVREELKPVMEALAAMLDRSLDPAAHPGIRLDRSIAPPRSVHGTEAPSRWASSSRTSLPPLQSALLSAGTDPYAALALGFGTSVDAGKLLTAPPALTHGLTTAAAMPLMVTLEHRGEYKVEEAGITVPFEAELAALVAFGAGGPARPARLLVNDGREVPRLDRPGGIDRPWLEIVDLSWRAERTAAASAPAPSGYAVLSAVGGADLAPALGKRHSGGHRTFVPAQSGARVRYTESAVPERFPGEGPGASFAVAAQDWFGRWSPWTSADHARVVVPPQRPVVREVRVDQGGPAPTALVDFTWDWADRTPARVAVRLTVRPEDQDPPTADGSVLAPGAPASPDLVLSFSGASADSPPLSVEDVTDDRTSTLRTYRCAVPGLALPFAAHPRLRVEARARAWESVRDTVASAFSAPVGTSVLSPLQPPAPVTTAPMRWASLPDAAGISRAALTWSGAGPTYTVYVADESAVARELGLDSPDLDAPAADRLAALRTADFGRARRAFRRLAEGLAEPRFDVTLPKGAKLIHFYGISAVSDTGVERPLPPDANRYLAVAPPVRLQPPPPRLTARLDDGTVRLEVAADPSVPVERIAIGRVDGRARAVLPEAAGAPILTATAATAAADPDGTLRWTLTDAAPLPPWQPVYYRAVATADADPARGEIPGRSEHSRVAEVLAPSPAAPTLTGLAVAPTADGTGASVVVFDTDALPIRTRMGAFTVAVTAVHAGAPPTVLRGALADLPARTGPLPGEPGLYRHRTAEGDPYRVTARLAATPAAVTAEATDPLGRRTSTAWSAP